MIEQADAREFAEFERQKHIPAKKKLINFGLVDWIWNVRGSIPVEPAQSNDEAFDKLDILFREYGTTHERIGDAITFSKKDQAAQDKMSVFDAGVLKIDQGIGGAVLHYRLSSRALLFCFCMPLLFLFFAQATVIIGKWQKPTAEAAEKAKKLDKKDAVAKELNPIDKFLGAPTPDKPKKDGAKKPEDTKHSPTSAYVFAAMFAVLYVIGRFLEQWLVRSLFKKTLRGT